MEVQLFFGDSAPLTVTSYQLSVISFILRGKHHTPRAQKALVSVQPHHTPDHCSLF